MRFPAILSASQPFQMCIFNRKNNKLILSNGSQLMGKRFVANWHASLTSTCKSRISKISMRCQILGGIHSMTFDPELRNEFKKKFPPDVRSWGVHSTTFDPELRYERFILISFMGFPTILSTLQPFQMCIFNRKKK